MHNRRLGAHNEAMTVEIAAVAPGTAESPGRSKAPQWGLLRLF